MGARPSTAKTRTERLLPPHWQQATRVAVNYQDEPNEKGTPPVKTDAYIYDDGHNLYVAFVAYDTDPSKIRAALRDRDTLWQDDNVGLVIDTFNDERTGYEFYVNPLFCAVRMGSICISLQ